jgi:hypothetical protein
MSKRFEMVDFIRGVAILDMMLVHYSSWLDLFPYAPIGKIIRYTDFAIEAFVLLAGFVVGTWYFVRFQVDGPTVIKRLLQRLAQIVAIQYFMILTLSIPIALVVGQALTGTDNVWQFAMKSFLFLNQVPLLHILPTFIPLLLISIPVLFAIRRNLDIVVLVASICIFTLGQWHPYLPLSVVADSIFPPALWQIYFVIGILLGKHRLALESRMRAVGRWNVLIALAVFTVMAFVYHGHHWIPTWGQVLQDSQLVVRKFPLNWLGLLYHGSIVYLLVATTAFAWSTLMRFQTVVSAVSAMGRYSLALFIIHVYLCFIVSYLCDREPFLAMSLIGLNIVGSFWIARIWDVKSEAGTQTRVVVIRSVAKCS